MEDIVMPKLSDTMTVGKIIRWRVSEGQAVREGDVLAEIESDKAQMELPAFRDGTVLKLVQAEGAEIPVGEVIAYVGEKGESTERAASVPDAQASAATQTTRAQRRPATHAEPEAGQPPEHPHRPNEAAPKAAEREVAAAERQAISPYALRLAEEKGIDHRQVRGTGPRGRITARDIEAAAAAKVERAGVAPPPGQEPPAGMAEPQPPATEPPPAARKPAPQAKGAAEPESKVDRLVPGVSCRLGVHAAEVKGTGTGGRVTADDVLAAAAGRAGLGAAGEEAEQLPPIEVGPGEAEVSEAPFRLRTMARRVSASARSIPHFFVTKSADVSELAGREKDLKTRFGATLTHLVILGVLRALERHADLNRSYDHGRIIAWHRVNLGIAVDTDEGLTVAVLADAAKLGLAEIASRSRELVELARVGKLTPAQRAHATFTVSNLGMHGVEHFQPVINPPSAVTLAVGAAAEAPVVRGGKLGIGRLMRLTAACDHRIVEGAAAAHFLSDLCRLLESPEELLAGRA